MDKEEKVKECCAECCREKIVCKGNRNNPCSSNAIYGLGIIGALFYFLKGATTITAVIIGIGKAIFWPAILMFKLLTYLGI